MGRHALTSTREISSRRSTTGNRDYGLRMWWESALLSWLCIAAADAFFSLERRYGVQIQLLPAASGAA